MGYTSEQTQEETTGHAHKERYIERWRFRIYGSSGRLIAEGFDFGSPKLDIDSGELRLEGAESQGMVQVSETQGLNGVELVRIGKKWDVRRWIGRRPGPEDENVMWKEFAKHKAMHIKAREAIRRTA